MTAVWITIAALTVGTIASKAAGTLVLGSRDLGERSLSVTSLVAPAILAAFVVYETFGAHAGGLTLDARAAGLGAAALALLARAPMIVVILLAAA
ncbi:MAG TPA: AzlD domain-containing protein, partial [Solirubrobacter sp.]|nr:AzlD domain-containing protein [Solirubrobacter sp.]